MFKIHRQPLPLASSLLAFDASERHYNLEQSPIDVHEEAGPDGTRIFVIKSEIRLDVDGGDGDKVLERDFMDLDSDYLELIEDTPSNDEKITDDSDMHMQVREKKLRIDCSFSLRENTGDHPSTHFSY